MKTKTVESCGDCPCMHGDEIWWCTASYRKRGGRDLTAHNVDNNPPPWCPARTGVVIKVVERIGNEES